MPNPPRPDDQAPVPVQPRASRPDRPPSRWRQLIAVLLVAVMGLGLVAGCATLDEKQREWIFQPGSRTWGGGAMAADGMEEVWIDYRPADAGAGDAADVRLHALWLPQARPDTPVMLYLHGARWDIRSSAHRMRRMHELGFSVLGIDYRGFGLSTATLPSEDTAHADAQAGWAWLAQRHPESKRYLFGHSLGGAIAVRLAAGKDDVAGLVVEGSFTSIPDVVSAFRWGWLPVGPLITQRFDAASRIGDVKAPVLVVHGSRDTLIPPALGQALFDRAPEPKRFVLVDGGSHHSTQRVGMAEYRVAVAELFGLRAGLPRGE